MPDVLMSDILRAVITDVMLILLIFTMSTPKYHKKQIYIIATGFITTVNLAINLYFYLTGNYDAVALTDFLMLVLIAVAIKPLFCETIMQWCFSFVTVLNFYAAVVVVSYYLCGLFPNPLYANTILRALFFGAMVLFFRKKARALYHEVKEYWHVYSLLTVVLLINYIYYFLSGDILQVMDNDFVPMLLLVFLTVFMYAGIFLSLKMVVQRYALRADNMKNQVAHALLQKTTNEMRQRLSLMDDAVRQMRIVNHDRRHFNATIAELLEQGETQEALLLIHRQSEALVQSPRNYCENMEVNAAVCYYVAVAEEKGVACDIRLNIPRQLAVDGLELAMVVSNLMENAINGVLNLSQNRAFKFIAVYTGQLILEIENHYDGKIKTDSNGIPISEKVNHGMGTQSVVFFAKKWNAELNYVITDNVFKVQMMI